MPGVDAALGKAAFKDADDKNGQLRSGLTIGRSIVFAKLGAADDKVINMMKSLQNGLQHDVNKMFDRLMTVSAVCRLTARRKPLGPVSPC